MPSKRRTTVGLLYLAATFLPIGLWATFDAQGFYGSFPGGGRQWLADDGPFNPHLVSDTGVGFLAVGSVLVLAACWADRRLVQASLVAVIVHTLPHVVFHLRHPNDALTTTDTALSTGGLGFALVLAVVLLASTTRASPGAGGHTPTGEPLGQSGATAPSATANTR